MGNRKDIIRKQLKLPRRSPTAIMTAAQAANCASHTTIAGIIETARGTAAAGADTGGRITGPATHGDLVRATKMNLFE